MTQINLLNPHNNLGRLLLISSSERKWKVLVAQSCLTLCDPMDCSHQAPLSMEFYRQEYCSGLAFPSPGDPSDPGIEPRYPTLQADSLLSENREVLNIISLTSTQRIRIAKHICRKQTTVKPVKDKRKIMSNSKF